MPKREWSPEMGEISGFGGTYEDGCRAMVLAGIEYLDANPKCDPLFKGFQGVFGLITEENADAKALTKAIMDARVTMNGKDVRCGDEATGAMHHAAIQHVFAYKRLGWDAYKREMTEREKGGA